MHSEGREGEGGREGGREGELDDQHSLHLPHICPIWAGWVTMVTWWVGSGSKRGGRRARSPREYLDTLAHSTPAAGLRRRDCWALREVQMWW